MPIELTDIVLQMERQAKVCETVAQDKTQESLTGASCDKEQNLQDAKEWTIRSKVWLEAAAAVRELVQPPLLKESGPTSPAQHPAACT